MIEEDNNHFNKSNNQLLMNGQKHLTGLFRTYEIMILAFLFCKHPDEQSRLRAFWGLINPDQTEFVTRETVANFLEKLQTICIALPE